VSDTAYFVYCTDDVHATGFGGMLNFHQELIPYEGNDSWVEGIWLSYRHALPAINYQPQRKIASTVSIRVRDSVLYYALLFSQSFSSDT
jgi:hypothetical protein